MTEGIFSEFVLEHVREQRAQNESMSVEEAVDSRFATNGLYWSLEMDQAPSNETENIIFEAIMAREEIGVFKYLLFAGIGCCFGFTSSSQTEYPYDSPSWGDSNVGHPST